MSVPSSVIHILAGVPINSTYEHSLFFETEAEQTDYFIGKRIKTYDKFTYLKPEHIIKVAGGVSNARSWNYLMFQNDTGKWYYHFINKVVYLNENAVELHIELDVIQTFLFDWKMHQCFVERTHTPTDEFGEHTIPEGLETGPLIYKSVHEINLDDCCVLMLTACNLQGENAKPHVYGGVFSGLQAYAVSLNDMDTLDTWINNGTHSEAVVSMWMYPKRLVSINGEWATNGIHTVTGINKSETVQCLDPIRSAGNTTIDGWGIKNKKTMGYPYTLLMVSNNMGGAATFHRERFKDGENITFNMYGALSPDSGVMLVPNNYKGASGPCFEEALTLGGFPSCAWDSDTYKVWLAQNQHTLDHQISQAKIQGIAGAVAGAGSLLTGNIMGGMAGLGAVYNAYSTTQGIMAQKADMEVQPAQARGNHSGNINLTHGRMGFTLYWMTITEEYAKSIDQYFSRYGYKVNQVMTPSLHNRKYFTYIKTIGCYVTGNLGAEDQVRVQNIFDKGITFWADPSAVGHLDYPNTTL